MSTRIDRQAGKYANAHGRKTRWRSIVTTLAAFVVFCTTYALILPAVTLQGKTYCALEEHLAHTDDCYEQVRTLTCPLSEEGHAHTDDCYETQQELICGTEESDGHVHGDDCYLEESVLICTSEDPDHIHGDSCFETQKVLSCGQEEQEAHHHTESCFETRQALVWRPGGARTAPTCGRLLYYYIRPGKADLWPGNPSAHAAVLLEPGGGCGIGFRLGKDL